MDFEAIRSSWGFRGKYWEVGDVAEDVLPEEKVPHHFKPISDEKSEDDLSLKTNNELKALLDEKNIKYPPNANKAKLLELLNGGGA